MDPLFDLYQSIVIDHHRNPRNHGLEETDDQWKTAQRRNPICGDDVTVAVKLDASQEAISAVRFAAQGCAICKASASIMTEAIAETTPAAALALRAKLDGFLATTEGPLPDRDAHGDLAALAGVRRFPARKKCAFLAWDALAEALGE